MLPCAFGCRGASLFGGVLHIAWNARFLFFPFFSSSFPEFFFHGEFLPAFSFLSFPPVVLSSFPPVLCGGAEETYSSLYTVCHPYIKVAIVAGFHLFPSRTEKLSPPAPMVLPARWESR